MNATPEDTRASGDAVSGGRDEYLGWRSSFLV